MTAEKTFSETSAAAKIIIGLVIAAAVVLGAVAVWKVGGDNRLGQDFKYDISEYMKTDPKLILYREVKGRSFDTGFAEARAIAVAPDGRIYVAGDRAIRSFDTAGSKLLLKPLNDSPRALCFGMDNWMYVAFKNSIVAYRPDDTTFELPPPPKNAVLTSIASWGADIYAADAANRTVHRYYKLNLDKQINRDDAPDGIKGYLVPSPHFDLAIDSEGVLRVADPGRHRIVTMNWNGENIGAWKSKRSMKIDGFCGCCNPVSIALMPDGQIVTAEKGLARVKLYDADGVFLGVVAGVESFPDHDPSAIAGDVGPVLDVAVDADGRVLVLDGRTARVRTFERMETE